MAPDNPHDPSPESPDPHTLILEVADDYVHGRISLHALTTDYESIVDKYEYEQRDRHEDLRWAWLQIEIMNALRHDDPSREPQDEDEVRETIDGFVTTFQSIHSARAVADSAGNQQVRSTAGPSMILTIKATDGVWLNRE
ncbi:hypothetical protein ACFT1A_26250 [Rhodococcus sp. NPDC057135]|uniref:hypothetical protein n=1 Tax=Rhodococcus sp. NPDC057135 TaxID=3346028 RepID=UPI0036254C8E